MLSLKGNNNQTKQDPEIIRSELDTFVQSILLPEHTNYRIVWISGIGGIGKSKFLEQLRDRSCGDDVRTYCLTAMVNERYSTPIAIMEAFAEQLRKAEYPLTHFEKEFASYKEDVKEDVQKIKQDDSHIRCVEAKRLTPCSSVSKVQVFYV